MRRRAALVSLGAAGALVLATVAPSGSVSAAPAPGPGDRPPGAAAGPPRGDLDGDRISDDLAPRLRAAAASDRFAVIVTGLGAARATDAVGRFDVTHRLPIIDGFSAEMTAAQARALARRPDVRRVEADGVVRVLDDAGNADFGAAQASLDRPGLDGTGVGICVIDTGTDPNHEQIAPRTVTFKDFVGTRTTAYDDHGHGTHVAAIAAGDGTGGSLADDFAGVAPGATLYAAKVMDSSGYGEDSDVVAGIQWCHAQPGVQVISMSLGGPGSDGTDAGSLAVDEATAGGDVVVVAAGNAGDAPETLHAPGVARGALTVGAVSDWSAPVGTDRHDDGIWLAAFSSRGPTIDGRTKPDVVAPGVSVRSAQSGTSAGYVTYSGTSMATPYVAGAVALALDAAPGLSPDAVRAALMGTAVDRGATGTDNEWGAGLIDVRAFVDAAAGTTPPRSHSFPTWERRTGSVPSNGSVEIPIAVPADGVGVPLAITLTLTSGRLNCDIYCQIGWSAGEWTPDLDVELRAPDGTLVADSQCALSGASCSTGRQEVVGTRPSVAGTYTLRVYAWSGGDGAGGSFDLDISRGPLGGTSTEPPPPPPPPAPNEPPVADAGQDRTVLANKRGKGSFTLDGRGSTDPDGEVVSYVWRLGSKVVGNNETLNQTKNVGEYSYTLTVTDDRGATDTDGVIIRVTK